MLVVIHDAGVPVTITNEVGVLAEIAFVFGIAFAIVLRATYVERFTRGQQHTGIGMLVNNIDG